MKMKIMDDLFGPEIRSELRMVLLFKLKWSRERIENLFYALDMHDKKVPPNRRKDFESGTTDLMHIILQAEEVDEKIERMKN